MLAQINPKLLQEWKKKGGLIGIWRCERCFRKSPIYKSGNQLIDAIHLAAAHDHKYCLRCRGKIKLKKNNNLVIKAKKPRINFLIQRYEPRVELPLILA